MGILRTAVGDRLPAHFDNISCYEYVIMPDHVHGILRLGAGNTCTDRTKMTLSKIIHAYKSSVSRIIHRDHNNNAFQWQRSFHDRVIRNLDELNTIRNYVQNNPHST
ncbi:MAG: transposase [Candidatus Omnitrophica bacterium]|nr:transposase [Candidatus Omnitrophota bacterium]